LLTLLFITRIYFTEESIKAHLLSAVSPLASEGITEKVSINDSLHAPLTRLESEPVPGDRHIIFLETVCVLNDSVRRNQSGLAITQRQACAVASAAYTNPDTKVYLLYTCPIIGNIGNSPEYVKQMLSYPNVRIWKLDISDYVKRTPVENWDYMGKIRSSDWPVAHASDVLRFITLWKYGGTYLDLDFVIRK
jgi:lactosylceramide 4-alpha-galactosyltransferase